MSTLRTTVEGDLLRVELNRPERLNAMNRPMLEELGEVFEGCRQSAVLLTGAGRAFCAGADLRELSFQPDAARSIMTTVGAVVRAMEACPAALVAHVRGPAIGGGLCLAVLCDLVYADPWATFAANQATRGLVPDMGIMWLLPRQVGELAARRLLLLGETFDASEAHRLGIVAEVAGAERALAVARELAGNRDCVALTKEGLRRARRVPLAELLEFEIEAELRAFQSERVQGSIRRFISG